MRGRLWKYVAIAAAALGVLVVGAVVGGNIVFALTRGADVVARVAGARADAASVPVVVAIGPEPAGESEEGIVVASVPPEAPAAEGGVQRGDILLEIDGNALNACADLLRYLGEAEAGREVDLVVRHGDDERTLTAVLEERDGRVYLGIVPCSCLAADTMVLPRSPGITITSVIPESPAAEAGLQERDVIVSVDGQRMGFPDSLADLIRDREPGAEVMIEIQRAGENQEIGVELGEHPDDADRPYLGIEYVPMPAPGLLHGLRIPFYGLRNLELDIDELEGYALPLDDLPLGLSREGLLRGAVVNEVTEDSPAAESGLAKGDVIIAVDGEPVLKSVELVDVVDGREPGDTVSLTVVRPCHQEESADEHGDDDNTGGEHDCEAELEIDVTLGEHPDETGKAYLGVEVGSYMRLRRSLGVEPRPGSRFKLTDLRRLLPFGRRRLEGHGPLRRFEFRWPPPDPL